MLRGFVVGGHWCAEHTRSVRTARGRQPTPRPRGDQTCSGIVQCSRNPSSRGLCITKACQQGLGHLLNLYQANQNR